ncbi:probable RNA polymerase II nuclear localization protein SLC7A6OS [Mizuhopecten yessoensis]|uniref:Probable RNA polymerase II nuclear localization protein SLC7A6OS n=1 Tax=Mizuhopecten yessoensis TaxID=6573 RepID=A0A210PZC0_MIZYE|nr:probable RNA polymerase II nuclear localization protein SLC7A6OS [Mizuhopecten yessoensis]OWF41835.1 RNA polymerase II nuclear localization protein SLC7A6OS [Mizuhopecten yessoensis]
MATIVRVKRRRADEPVENIVVSCKRRKNDTEDSNLQSSLKFAGTAKSRDDVSKHIRDAIRKDKLQKEYKQHHVDVSDKTRQNHRQQVKAARFKVTSSFRAIALDNLDLPQDETDIENKENQEPTTSEEGAAGSSVVVNKAGSSASENQASSSVFRLYDVEAAGGSRTPPTYESVVQQSQSSSGITCNAVPLVQERVPQSTASQDEDYVYDLYFTNNRDFSFKLLENALTIEAFGSDFVHDYMPHREDEEVYEDEDDSNDEDNWRNDYPDEDPHIVDNQLDSDYFYSGDVVERQAFGDAGDAGLAEWMHTRCNIEDADELSSGEEDSAYSGEPLNPVSTSNSYQSYYRKVCREMEDGEGHSPPDDDNDEND